MIKFLRKLLRRRRPAVNEYQAIPEERLGEMFEHVPDTPGWKATLAQLDMAVQELCELALDEKLTEGQLRWRLGGAEALLAFRQRLTEREQEARARAEEKSTE